MKHTPFTFLIVFTIALFSVNAIASEKPIQHLELPDVTSFDQAKQVFTETTLQLQEKKKLDAVELNEIHLITYSLEKAVAYFAQNMEGSQQATAKKLAEVVESIHIGSENNRAEETKAYLQEYFKLADGFSLEL